MRPKFRHSLARLLPLAATILSALSAAHALAQGGISEDWPAPPNPAPFSGSPLAARNALASPWPSDSTPDPSAAQPAAASADGSSGNSWPAGYGSTWKSSSLVGSLQPVCDECETHGLQVFVGYDSWRGISDDSWQNNGISTGFNYGTRLGEFSEWSGIGLQAGGSVGVFNWSGEEWNNSNQRLAQTQGFVTYGLFRKANERCRWSASLVQDWMINNNFGEYGTSPLLGQWRGQVGYAVSARNEYGIWGTWRSIDDTRNVAGVGTTIWRPINTLNAYWHYKWAPGGADTYLWVGVPERDRLEGVGSLGDYIAGALANVPLSDRVALYTLVTYMHPSSRPGPVGSTEDAWNFTIGLSFYPGANSRSSTVAGRCWMPQLPVANNGYFMVDTSRH